MTVTEVLNSATFGLRDGIAGKMGISGGTLSNWLKVHNRLYNFNIDRLFDLFSFADEINMEKKGATAMDGARLFIISNLSFKNPIELNGNLSDKYYRIMHSLGEMARILNETGGGKLERMHPQFRAEYIEKMGLVMAELTASARELGFDIAQN